MESWYHQPHHEILGTEWSPSNPIARNATLKGTQLGEGKRHKDTAGQSQLELGFQGVLISTRNVNMLTFWLSKVTIMHATFNAVFRHVVSFVRP